MTDSLLSWLSSQPYARRRELLPALRASRRSPAMREAFGRLVGVRVDAHAVDRAVMFVTGLDSTLQLLYESGPRVPARGDTREALEQLERDGLVTRDLTGAYHPKEIT